MFSQFFTLVCISTEALSEFVTTAQFLFAAKMHQNKHISVITDDFDASRTILSYVKHLIHHCNICFVMGCPKIISITQMSREQFHMHISKWQYGSRPLSQVPHPRTPQNMDGYMMKPQRLLHPEHSHQMLLLHHLKF